MKNNDVNRSVPIGGDLISNLSNKKMKKKKKNLFSFYYYYLSSKHTHICSALKSKIIMKTKLSRKTV